MNRMKVKDLREIAKSSGLRGYSRLRKSELISFIMSEEERHKNDEIERRRQERLRKSRRRLKSKRRKNPSRKPDAKRSERRLNWKRNAEPNLRGSSQTKGDNALRTSPENVLAVKKQNPKESNVNGWKDKLSRLRPNAKLMNRHRKKILRKIGRKRSVSIERRKKR